MTDPAVSVETDPVATPKGGRGHQPVLLVEVLTALAPKSGETYLDATFGGGGYARAILAMAECRLIGLDRDPDAVARGRVMEEQAGARFRMIQGRFGELDTLVEAPLNGVVMDIGVSSFQLDEGERGFSFQADAPLDMRMGKDGPTAADAVNQLSEPALMELIFDYGEDDEARRIARAVVQTRAAAPITTTARLADVVERAVGGRRGARTHPATKTFQALRMLVNDELGELARGLRAAERRLAPGGRLAVVSFHSLEDRLVKRFLLARAGQTGGGSRHAPEAPEGPAPSFSLPSRKPIIPQETEISANPRARSAALRYGVRTDAPAWEDEQELRLAARAHAEWERLG